MMERPAHVPGKALRPHSVAPSAESWVAAVMLDGTAAVQWWWQDQPGSLAVAVDDDLFTGAEEDVAALAMDENTPAEWVEHVMPKLMRCDGIDAMTKLRIAAKMVEGEA